MFFFSYSKEQIVHIFSMEQKITVSKEKQAQKEFRSISASQIFLGSCNQCLGNFKGILREI